MRDIKFRGYSGYHKKCYYGYYVKIHNKHYIYNCYGHRFEVDLNSIMQFTGLHDQNGKEIYDGDIVKINNDVMLVSWNDRFSSFCLNKKDWMFSHFFGEAVESGDCEVIGNIYENPELIKVK